MKLSFILRMKNNDSEGDRYDYYKSPGKGCDVITPFKDEAMVFTKTTKVPVYTKGWEFIKI